jgi:fatty acid desaturase
MAEETTTTTTQEKKEPSKALKTLLKLIAGLALIVLGIMAIISWWGSLLILIKGCLGLFMILVGAIFLAIAKE